MRLESILTLCTRTGLSAAGPIGAARLPRHHSQHSLPAPQASLETRAAAAVRNLRRSPPPSRCSRTNSDHPRGTIFLFSNRRRIRLLQTGPLLQTPHKNSSKDAGVAAFGPHCRGRGPQPRQVRVCRSNNGIIAVDRGPMGVERGPAVSVTAGRKKNTTEPHTTHIFFLSLLSHTTTAVALRSLFAARWPLRLVSADCMIAHARSCCACCDAKDGAGAAPRALAVERAQAQACCCSSSSSSSAAALRAAAFRCRLLLCCCRCHTWQP